jgi:hypothetical protein
MRIVNHLLVEDVEILVWHNVLDDHEAVLVDVADGLFEVPRRQLSVGDFLC